MDSIYAIEVKDTGTTTVILFLTDAYLSQVSIATPGLMFFLVVSSIFRSQSMPKAAKVETNHKSSDRSPQKHQWLPYVETLQITTADSAQSGFEGEGRSLDASLERRTTLFLLCATQIISRTSFEVRT